MENIQEQIKNYSTQTEQIFLSLADRFPALLNKKGGSSLEELRTMLENLKTKNDASTSEEKDFFSNFDRKYSGLFDALNKKIEDLTVMNSQVKTVKEDSEEMELITLNAMVISIKSGEKGRAFSCITENLKRLSNQMYQFSDSLINEEQELLKNITSLKEIFGGIVASQKLLANLDNNGTANIESLMTTSAEPLSVMSEHVKQIYAPIQKTMEGLQMQDIIRQALDHVILCLKESATDGQLNDSSDTTLDSICFNIELMKISESVLTDIISMLDQSSKTFNQNWLELTNLLKMIENEREDYLNRHLGGSSSDSMKKHIEDLITGFTNLMQEFNHYHIVQKDLEFTTKSITERARTMYSVYENLKPVIANLSHVRILQQIEVAKNEAISSVRDSVTDMDNHIISAKKSLDSMQQTLQDFSVQTEKLLSQFTGQITKDNEQMKDLRAVKGIFFNELKQASDRLAYILQNFTVLPEGFEKDCSSVQNDLQKFSTIKDQFGSIVKMMGEREKELSNRKTAILSERGITGWEIRNDKFKELIEHFTITSHKEVAGKIGGFGIEKGTESGEITFF